MVHGHRSRSYPLQGSLDSGVTLDFAAWYRFRLETLREVGGLRILFKIWPDGAAEPGSWQIDALDPAADYGSGRLGLWGTGWGGVTGTTTRIPGSAAPRAANSARSVARRARAWACSASRRERRASASAICRTSTSLRLTTSPPGRRLRQPGGASP